MSKFIPKSAIKSEELRQRSMKNINYNWESLKQRSNGLWLTDSQWSLLLKSIEKERK